MPGGISGEECLSDEETFHYWLSEVPQHVLEELAEEAYNDVLISADLTQEQWDAVDAPTWLRAVPRLSKTLEAQQTLLDEIHECYSPYDDDFDDGLKEQLLAEIRAVTAQTAALLSATEAQSLKALEIAAAGLSHRQASLAAWQRSLLSQMPEEPAERLLYLLALSGDRQARAELVQLNARRAALGCPTDLLAVQILALLSALEELAGDTEQLLRWLAVLLPVMVLAPVLYRIRPRPSERLRGSLDRTAPPVLRAASSQRVLAPAAGVRQHSPP